jgi:hypothetical protein
MGLKGLNGGATNTSAENAAFDPAQFELCDGAIGPTPGRNPGGWTYGSRK